MKYLLSKIEAIGSELDAIPDPDKTSHEISTREVVRVLASRLARLDTLSTRSQDFSPSAGSPSPR